MIRFLADASLRHAIVTGCLRREPAIDFLSAHLAKLEGMADPDVLAIAAEQSRILVTQDFRTMPRHFGEFLEAGRSSPGVEPDFGNAAHSIVTPTRGGSSNPYMRTQARYNARDDCDPDRPT